jgi:hypothetical protein
MISFDWFNKDFMLLGLQFMEYETYDPVTEKPDHRGKSIALGFMFLTITIFIT